MGLDTLQVVLETERTFAIKIPDAEAANVVTVGDLYRLVLAKLNLPYEPAAPEPLPVAPVRRSIALHVGDWSAQKVWGTLHRLIVDELQVDGDEVREAAAFQADLRAD